MMRDELQQLTGLRQIIMMQKKVQKIRGLINMGKYDADLAKYIPSLLDLAIQRMLDDIDTREKVAHPSYKDMERLDFQILLTENCYVNPNSIHVCFPIKIKKKSNNNGDIDGNLITVNDFFAHWIKEISVIRYGSDKGLPPTFLPWEVYQHSDQKLKNLPPDNTNNTKKDYNKNNTKTTSV